MNLCQHSMVFSGRFRWSCILLGLLLITSVGCTIHPDGENQLRQVADKAGTPFTRPYTQRQLPTLPPDASPEQLFHYAMLNNPGVEQAYWQWQAAIEQIPQAGTEMTVPMISGNPALENGGFSAANTTLGLSNMTSSDIRWPSKPAADAQIALQQARAAEWNFFSTSYTLRRDVRDAWFNYVQTSILLHLYQRRALLGDSLQSIMQSEVESGSGSTSDILSAQNDLIQIKIHIIQLQENKIEQLAMLNQLLGRAPDAPLAAPAEIPPIEWPSLDDSQLLALMAARNPELAGLEEMESGGRIAIDRARMDYIPDFDLGASTSLDGGIQSFSAAIMVPLVRYQAINASIRQAQDQLNVTQAALRDARNRLVARVIIDVLAIRNDRTQIDIFQRSLLPQIRQQASVAQMDYQQGQGSPQDQLMAQQTELDIQETLLNLQVDAAQKLDDIEAVIAGPISPASPIALTTKPNE